jgi:hypothetical protein
MIISLFIDETPLHSGSGDNLGARADDGQGGQRAGALPNRRGDDRHDHVKHAKGVHCLRFPGKAQKSAW